MAFPLTLCLLTRCLIDTWILALTFGSINLSELNTFGGWGGVRKTGQGRVLEVQKLAAPEVQNWWGD